MPSALPSSQSPMVIVGGGPVGLVAALLMAELGRACVLVDQAGRDHHKHFLFAPSSLSLLRHVGYQGSARAFYAIDVSIKHSVGQRMTDEKPLVYGVDSNDLMKGLSDALLETNVHRIQGRLKGLKGLDQGFHQLHIETEKGDQKITASHVIAADGKDSFCRHAKEIGVQAHDSVQILSCEVGYRYGDMQSVFLRFEDDMSLACVPLDDHRMKVIAVTKVALHPWWAMSPSDLLLSLNAAMAYRCGKLVDIGSPPVTFALDTHAADALTVEGCTLMGNAALTLPPLGAQNLNMGLRDAAIWFDALKVSNTDEAAQNIYRDKRQQEHRLLAQLINRGMHLTASSHLLRKTKIITLIALFSGVAQGLVRRLGQDGNLPLPSIMSRAIKEGYHEPII